MSHSNAQLQPPSKCFPRYLLLDSLLWMYVLCIISQYRSKTVLLYIPVQLTMPINKVSYAGHTEHTESITKYISFIIPNLKILCLLTPSLLLCYQTNNPQIFTNILCRLLSNSRYLKYTFFSGVLFLVDRWREFQVRKGEKYNIYWNVLVNSWEIFFWSSRSLRGCRRGSSWSSRWGSRTWLGWSWRRSWRTGGRTRRSSASACGPGPDM